MVLHGTRKEGREELDFQRQMERLIAFAGIVADEPAEGQGTSQVRKERSKCNLLKRVEIWHGWEIDDSTFLKRNVIRALFEETFATLFRGEDLASKG